MAHVLRRPQLGNSTPAVACGVSVHVETARRCTAVGGGSRLRRIDDEHTNPRARWIELGMPQYANQIGVDIIFVNCQHYKRKSV